MCGITGFFDSSCRAGNNELKSIATNMTNTLSHRGPDDAGVWVDAEVGLALGHRRLSIVDLSPAGHQPMPSASDRYLIVFNGEIYNHAELRKEIEAASSRLTHNSLPVNWRGHSDTEVILAAIEKWGLENTVKRFTGMFAFALWDRQSGILHLVRDRIGEKPLYYGWAGHTFLFGSELKALKAHPAWQGEINRDAVALFLRHNYIPAPYSIYKGIRKLLPGTIMNIEVKGKGLKVKGDRIQHKPYWQLKDIAENGIQNPFDGSETEAIDNLDRLLRAAVSKQMVAEVPIGAFLSGGIDSSTVVALMQAQSIRPVKTFTIGFNEPGYNEAKDAKAVARHLGTEHTELYISHQAAMDVIPKLPTLYDEPFSDSSQIPTFLVSKMARQHVTVSLSGDAGDELFGGYNRYFWGRDIWNKTQIIPRQFRSLIARAITSVSPQKLDQLTKVFSYLMPAELKSGRAGEKLHKLAKILDKDSPESLYRELLSHWKNPASVVINSREPETVITDSAQWASLPDFTQRMMYLDSMSYLPDDILVKVDRAAMGVSLETRVPFLDHNVIEFAWRLPLSMKLRNGNGKWIMRQVLCKYVPVELVDRPKMGFGVPLDKWLRGPLREWAESLLEEKRLVSEGFFKPQPIRQKWTEHLSGKRNWQYHLWDVLIFQQWLENQANS